MNIQNKRIQNNKLYSFCSKNKSRVHAPEGYSKCVEEKFKRARSSNEFSSSEGAHKYLTATNKSLAIRIETDYRNKGWGNKISSVKVLLTKYKCLKALALDLPTYTTKSEWWDYNDVGKARVIRGLSNYLTKSIKKLTQLNTILLKISQAQSNLLLLKKLQLQDRHKNLLPLNIVLDFSKQEISDEFFEILAAKFKELKKVSRLNIDFNQCQFGIVGEDCLIEALAQLESLTALHLNLTYARKATSKKLLNISPLFKELEKFTSLTTLKVELEGVLVSMKGIQTSNHTFKELALNLELEFLSSKYIKSLFNAINSLYPITILKLKLEGDFISMKSFQTLNHILGNLKSLTNLELELASPKQEYIDSLFKIIGDLSSQATLKAESTKLNITFRNQEDR